MINFGESLKYQRELAGISQLRLSNITGISSQNINRWESNKVLPNIDFCVKLADFYGISVDELIGRDNYIQSQTFSKYDKYEKEVISLIREMKDKSDIAEVIRFIQELNKRKLPYIDE